MDLTEEKSRAKKKKPKQSRRSSVFSNPMASEASFNYQVSVQDDSDSSSEDGESMLQRKCSKKSEKSKSAKNCMPAQSK